jgi:hypothetical protein
MLNPMLLLLKLIYYGINMKIGKKAEKGHSPIDQAPLIIKQKINNQWRDKIKQLNDFLFKNKKTKKTTNGD